MTKTNTLQPLNNKLLTSIINTMFDTRGGKEMFYVYEKINKKINTTRCVYCVFRTAVFKVIEGQREEVGTCGAARENAEAQLVSVSVLLNMSAERVQIFRNYIFL